MYIVNNVQKSKRIAKIGDLTSIMISSEKKTYIQPLKGQIISEVNYIILNSSKKPTKYLPNSALPKGQLISKGNFGVFNSSKKRT